MNENKEIFGIVERVSLPELGLINVPAKIDTGAYSGALHCSNIEEFVNESGKKVLRFTPSDKHSHSQEVRVYKRSYIRSSTGHRIKRYLFDTKVVIKGIERVICIGLSDRSDMNYEILIGRRFLAENNILVDVCTNQDLDIDKEKKDANRNTIKRSR